MTWDKTIVVGYLGATPELNETRTGKSVCNFSVAVTRNPGRDNEETIWYSCTAWERTAENVSRYCQKGDRVLIEGNVSLHTWTGKDGQERSQLKLNVYRLQFLTTRKERAQANSAGGLRTRFPQEEEVEELDF